MVDRDQVKVGDKVHYQPSYMAEANEWVNGIVKEIPEEASFVRVVYHCGGEWDKFMDYTSQLTLARDLHLGWKH